MAAKDLGNKFVCFKCSTKFYDLKKPDPVCPKCGSDQRDSPATKPSEGRKSRLSAVPKIIEPVEVAETPEVAEEDAEEVDEVEEPVVEEEP
jgi:uncharacterized protein (TIGR02300 family)